MTSSRDFSEIRSSPKIESTALSSVDSNARSSTSASMICSGAGAEPKKDRPRNTSLDREREDDAGEHRAHPEARQGAEREQEREEHDAGDPSERGNEDAPELLGPQTYGRRLVLRGNLEVLAPEPDRARLSAMIGRLLADEAVDEIPHDLSAAGLRVAEVAISEGPVDPAIVSALLRPLSADIRALSPVNRVEVPEVPVYLLHGEKDPVVSVADLEQLAAHLEEHGVEVEVHRTEVFSHVKRMGEGRPSIFQAWPLFSFLADVLSDAGF